MNLTPAIFLDRDNTLTIDEGYSFEIEKFQWVNGAAQALSAFQKAGIPVFIVTNQGGIGRGIFTESDMHRFNNHLIADAASTGGQIKDVAFCPHHPMAITSNLLTPCPCRKPGHRMIADLAEKWSLDLAASVMIGDRESDVAAGKAAGCHAYLFDGSDLLKLSRHVLNQHFTRLLMERS